MHSVEIRLDPRELTRKMAEMRIWLDERRFEPSTFFCGGDEEALLVSIAFRVPNEAAAFAAHFGGRTATV